METKAILSKVDHTHLSVTATWDEIRALCDDAIFFGTASVCIPPRFVKRAKAYVGDRMKICTVIGFPNGYQTVAAKVFETQDAVRNGADEIDMVICQAPLKENRPEEVLEEIVAVRKACEGKVLKVIVETCLLTKEEKIKMCHITARAGADYIKTSTGFSKGGATAEDVSLFAEHVLPPLKIKAAGGIQSLADAKTFLSLGAERLGTSRIVKLVKEKEKAL